METVQIVVTQWRQGKPVTVNQYPETDYATALVHLRNLGLTQEYDASYGVSVERDSKVIASLCILGFPGKSGYQSWIVEYPETGSSVHHSPLVCIP